MPVKADESLPMVNFKVSKSTAGELLASQFINRTNRDRLKLYVDQETQQLIFDSIVFITSGVSIFGLMYGLDSLLIAGAIASFWAYLALFVAGLLLKNIVLGWLTNNFFPDRPDHYLNAKKLLKTSAVSCLLLYFLLIIEPLPNPLFLWFCCSAGFEEANFNLRLFQMLETGPRSLFLDVSCIDTWLSYKLARIPCAIYITSLCAINIPIDAILTAFKFIFRLCIELTRWILSIIFLPIGRWLYSTNLDTYDLTVRAWGNIKHTTYMTFVQNPIRYWVARWLDIMNFSPSLHPEPGSLRVTLKSFPELTAMVNLAERILKHELEQKVSLSPKEQFSFLLHDYLHQNPLSALFFRSKPDASIAKTLLNDLRSPSTTITDLVNTLTTHKATHKLSIEFSNLAEYIECVLLPWEQKLSNGQPEPIPLMLAA